MSRVAIMVINIHFFLLYLNKW